jgi:hypothetical protein
MTGSVHNIVSILHLPVSHCIKSYALIQHCPTVDHILQPRVRLSISLHVLFLAVRQHTFKYGERKEIL